VNTHIALRRSPEGSRAFRHERRTDCPGPFLSSQETGRGPRRRARGDGAWTLRGNSIPPDEGTGCVDAPVTRRLRECGHTRTHDTTPSFARRGSAPDLRVERARAA